MPREAVAEPAMILFLSGIATGLFIAVTVWAIFEVKAVEHWNK